ncbi:putative DCC family thiol-disulfide oxidoreductase YuxK [Flavobacterium sp. 28A]|uniref:thiol-disulfide oxidoreductase DCC family protein n=1 Tax=Flavobacterium sp. 28A TaxID=2735895 RepID=UPI001570A320|nr:DCC1-like thiol-disulfide oxidoreductase family protein [Flavobacterium sp. 28A]NRT14830.1 putative DCC family thiol-disulfide oxidoreductase YuxK [Flavobacterium sp. 28A]
MQKLPENKKIVLFDGVCNLCDSAVQFIIKNDKKDIFRFASLQSEIGQEICKHIGIDVSKMDSIILYEPGIAYYYKSEAALNITSDLGGAISLLSVFKVLPSGFSNVVYDFIARNRYKWYGKKESCMIPPADLKSKFLD